jgi:TonB-linked SusC/RagA family outer membrane protein
MKPNFAAMQIPTHPRVSWRSLWWTAALLLLGSTTAWAQIGYQINGTVTDALTEDPIIGAALLVDGENTGTVTDYNGRYELNLPGPGDYTLIVSYLGYANSRQLVSLDATTKMATLDIALSEDAIGLDQIVVTGASVATSRRQLGNAISTLSSKELSDNGSIAVDQALSGKISGALVQQNSGDPAGGISIRLRGPSTISGSSDPLYIIDGIIVNNNSTQLVDIGGTSQNRLVDINPADIDRIEVIKGAAAAAIYGARASNGVVQIFTKRGSSGAPKFNFSTSVRINELRKQIEYNEVPLAWEDPFDRGNLTTVPVTRYNLQDEIFDTGAGTENNISVSGGNDKTKYFVSGSYLLNEGIVKNTNFERYGGRLNLDQIVNDWMSFDFGLNYTTSQSQDVPNGGISAAYGALTGFLFSENSVNPAPDASGNYPVTSLLVARTNPAEAVTRFDFGQRTNRVISNLGLTLTPVEGLSVKYRFGIDTYNQSATGFVPVGNTSTNPSGFATRNDANVFQYNSDLTASYSTDITSKIKSTTVAGGTWQYERFERIGLTSDRLAPTVQTATGGTVIGQVDSRSEVSYWGAFIQETLGFSDKLYLTGALRMDGASVFGPDERNQLFAKASASYVISSEDFWQNAFGRSFNTFKIRASWGQSGNLTAIGAFDRFLNYNPIAINGTSGVVPSTLLGNENLAPERMEEIELGFDAGFLQDRVGLEFTYYQQDVTDLLLQREVAPSTGFGTRFENVGAMTNTGIELLLRAGIVRSKDFSWDLTATYSANRNEVTEVVGDRITLPGSFATSFVIPGEALGVFYRQFYARDDSGNILLDDDGYPFRGTTEDGLSSKVIGDPNPDWFGSLINEFSYKNFDLRIQFDAVQGFDVFNWNRRLLDNVIFGGGVNVGRELLGERAKGYGGAQAGIFEEFVEDGSFVKLRELALSYTIRPANNKFNSLRISLIGRNLLSFDDYQGWDPEINTPGQSNGVRGFDFAGVPIPRTYQLGLNLSF